MTVQLYVNGKDFGLEYALSFDGLDDYVEVPYSASLDISEALTIMAWIKPANLPYSECIIGGRYDIWRLMAQCWSYNQWGFRFLVHGVGWTGEFHGDTQLQNDVWYHVAVTYDGDKVKLYLNGNPDGEYPQTGTIETGNYPFYLAHGVGAGQHYFGGVIDEVRVYNRALTLEEIRYEYNLGRGRYTPKNQEGLVLWLHFDEGEGNTAYDSSYEGNDGTIHGASWTSGKVEKPDITRSMSILDEGKGKITLQMIHDAPVSVGDSIEVKKDGSTIAKGTVTKIVTERKHHRKTVYCIGRTDLLYREVVLDKDHRVYANMDAGAIVKDLVDHYFSGVLTSNNVNTSTGTTINRIDGYGKTVGDVIEELAERAGCSFYVDNSDDVHFFLEGAESTGLTINESDVIDLRKSEWGDQIGKVTVEGRSGFSGSAGSGQPHIYIHDRRVRSSTEASSIASALLNLYNQTRKSAEIRLYDFWNLKTEKTVTVNLPNDGYDNSTETIRRVQWDFQGKTCFTTVTVGDKNPGFEDAISKILRGLGVKRDDLDVYGERRHYRWSGESTDGYVIMLDNTASMEVSAGTLHCETGTGGTLPNPASAWIQSADQTVDFHKNPVFKCQIKLSSVTNVNATVRIRQHGGYVEHFGFRIEDNQLQGWSGGWNGSTTVESTIDLMTINAGEEYTLEAVYIYNQFIEFYVNGELKGVKTDNLPQGLGPYEKAMLMDVFLSNVTEENKKLDVYHWVVEQDW